MLVERLLQAGADPNYCEDYCEIRPLHFATLYNTTDAIIPLVKSGATMNKKTIDGDRPIDIAIRYKRQTIADLLKSFSHNLN